MSEKTIRRTGVSRRTLLVGAGGAALAAGVQPWPLSRALAQAGEVVLANWGGESIQHFETAFGKPFTADTGVAVVIDGSGPTAGKIRGMVEAGAVTWDICDSSVANSYVLGEQGLVREIDYSVVDKSQYLDGLTWPYSVANYIFSNVLTFNTSVLGDAVPKTWADFWDVKTFPGLRTMRRNLQGALETALLADGVPMNEIYPIDEERAFAKLAEIREHTIFWSSASESQQLLRTGEAVMGNLWSTRSAALAKETGGQIDYTFNEGMVIPGAWVVPSNNPAGDTVWEFMKSTADPERQAKLFELWSLAPVNPAAEQFIDPALNARNPASEANLAMQFNIDLDWYIENQERLEPKFLEVISG
ncbi:ABC transporter substrate-binding protein [Acuticoccus sediminis]|uniref:ABC transporter substrate-binding protein n=1 Tax=Acuticoccus sediminis TaxID=2184697 RepID=UPI001CFE28F7|nr:ABC transporter substrate-binding protein [Acuticoccus sediminis]